MIAVTIPADLAADFAARPEAYRPDVEIGDEVLDLASGYSGSVESINHALSVTTSVIARRADGLLDTLTCWPRCGSVDGGPRPAVGQRVPVLGCIALGTSEHVGLVGVAPGSDDDGPVDVDLGAGYDHEACLATRWALLPDAAGPCTCGTRPPADGAAAGSSPDLDRLPPGALPASQLHDVRKGAGPLPGTVFDADGPPGDVRADIRAAVERMSRRAAAPEIITAGEVPPGEWRVGSHAPRNLYIGPPRPYGVDVGRMDSPELAAFVVEAVNGHAAGLRIADRAFELDEEVRRLRTALRKLAVECTTAGLLPSAVAAARDVLENPRSPVTSATLPAETPESVHDHAHAGKAADGHQRETRYGGVDEEPT